MFKMIFRKIKNRLIMFRHRLKNKKPKTEEKATTEENKKEQETVKKQTYYQEILDDIIKRDYQDMHRETAPLKQAEDAVLVDTTKLNLEESAAAIVKIITDRVK